MCAYGYIARVVRGSLLEDVGPEGPASAYPVDALPKIMAIRVAIQRALDACLTRGHTHTRRPRRRPSVIARRRIRADNSREPGSGPEIDPLCDADPALSVAVSRCRGNSRCWF